MGRATSTASLAFFLPGVAFCAAAVPSPSAASLPAAALLPFAASLQIPYVCTMSCMHVYRLRLPGLNSGICSALLRTPSLCAYGLSNRLGSAAIEQWVGTENSSPEGGFALLEHVFSQDILQAHLNKPPISPHCTCIYPSRNQAVLCCPPSQCAPCCDWHGTLMALYRARIRSGEP